MRDETICYDFENPQHINEKSQNLNEIKNT